MTDSDADTTRQDAAEFVAFSKAWVRTEATTPRRLRATLGDALEYIERQAEARERDRRQIARLTERLIDAQQLLARLEFLQYGSRTRLYERPDEVFECPVCGWPQGGHRGPGRIKGNAENTHEEGCSLYAALHGEPAPRLLTCNDRPARAVLADEEDAANG